LLGKYNITLQDIASDIKKDFTFKLRNNYEAILFQHCVLKYFGDDIVTYRTDKLTKILELTSAEHIIFRDFLKFHIKQYRKEINKILDKTLLAYVNKHELFSDEIETTALSEDSMNTFQTIVKMLDDVTYYKSLK
jgi:hypothetical protein